MTTQTNALRGQMHGMELWNRKNLQRDATGVGLLRRSGGTRFRVTEVDARHERLLSRGVPVLKPPTTQAWGRRSVWLRDPDGNIVNLYQDA
ncbi:VOC family protein [Streptomyces sp. NPDC101234]|uniref:VOC family protein n=1 Tax=Streptomyces sp. NPDC101234 TaxID=3366138 RepID=UPI0037F1A631